MASNGVSPAFGAIHRQFEFGGDAVAARLERLEVLIQDIEPGASYPIDWMVYRITGITPEASNQPEVVAGEVLVGELVDLVEEVDRTIGPGEFDPQTHVDAEEAARRIGISRRTLQRWRRFGLPMRKWRHPDGSVRAGVRLDSLARFARNQADRISRTRRRTPIRPEEQAAMGALLDRLLGEGASRGEAIRIIAQKFGRSISAVRARHVEARGVSETIGSRRLASLVARARRRVIPRSMLARRLGRSIETIRRHELDMRWAMLQDLEPDVVEVPNIDRDDAGRVFGVAGMIDDLPRTLDGSTPDVWLRTIRELSGREDPEVVKARLAAMHFARAVAARDVDGLRRDASEKGFRPGERMLDPIETSLRWWGLLVERNVVSGLAGGLRRLEQSVGRRVETWPPRTLRAGLGLLVDSTVDAVRNFDPARRVVGHDLDRAVGLVVSKRIASASIVPPLSGAGARGIHGARMPVNLLAAIPRPARDLLEPERWWRAVLASGLDQQFRKAGDWSLLSTRFGFQTPGRPLDLRGLGAAIGSPATRFGDDLESALARLRSVAMDDSKGA